VRGKNKGGRKEGGLVKAHAMNEVYGRREWRRRGKGEREEKEERGRKRRKREREEERGSDRKFFFL
jgi:hypothetical protein